MEVKNLKIFPDSSRFPIEVSPGDRTTPVPGSSAFGQILNFEELGESSSADVRFIHDENIEKIEQPSSVICRTCLLESSEMHSLYKVIEISQRNATLSLFLKELTNLECLIDDGLPIFLCEDCVQSISNAISFKEMCMKSDYILRGNITENMTLAQGTEVLQKEIANNTDYENVLVKEEMMLDIQDMPISQENAAVQITMNDTENPQQGSSKENLIEMLLPDWMPNVDPLKKAKSKKEYVRKKRNCFACGRRCDNRAKYHIDKSGTPWCKKCYRLKSIERVSKKPKVSIPTKDVSLETPVEKKNICFGCESNLENIPKDKVRTDSCKRSWCMECYIKDRYKGRIPKDTKEVVQKNYFRKEIVKTEVICFGCDCKMVLSRSYSSSKIYRTSTGSTWCYKCYQRQKKIRRQLFKSATISPEDSAIDEQVLGILKLKRKPKITERPTQFICNVCGKITKKYENLKSHLITHSQEKPFECSLCGKNFKTKECIQSHMTIHLPKKLQCSTCSTRFSCAARLKAHEHIHNKDKKCILCTKCGKKVANSSDMKRHLQIHSQERIFQCEFCDKSYCVENYLRVHRLTHMEKRFECQICGKKVNTKASLLMHINTHNKVRPFACKICDKTFTQRPHLKRHMYLHTGEKKYTCPICPVGYIQHQDFKRHMRKHKENGDIVEESLEVQKENQENI